MNSWSAMPWLLAPPAAGLRISHSRAVNASSPSLVTGMSVPRRRGVFALPAKELTDHGPESLPGRFVFEQQVIAGCPVRLKRASGIRAASMRPCSSGTRGHRRANAPPTSAPSPATGCVIYIYLTAGLQDARSNFGPRRTAHQFIEQVNSHNATVGDEEFGKQSAKSRACPHPSRPEPLRQAPCPARVDSGFRVGPSPARIRRGLPDD